METLMIIYMIVSIIFAVCALTYVTVDIIIEIIRKRASKNNDNKKEEKKEEPPIPTPVIVQNIDTQPEPEPVVEIVEQITSEEADKMMTNSMAIKKANFESGEGHGKQGIINIGLIGEHFAPYSVVTLDALKEKKLVARKICRLRVLAHGILDKPLTIKAEEYSVQAMKMIELTGGTVIVLKD